LRSFTVSPQAITAAFAAAFAFRILLLLLPESHLTTAMATKHQLSLSPTDDQNYDSSLRSSTASAAPSVDSREEARGYYIAVYSFNNSQIRELIKKTNLQGAKQADALSKLLQEFDVELVSIGLPQQDPVTHATEQELTICARNVKALGIAMVKLTELGLPFKKRIDNWYDRKVKKPSRVVQHDSSRAVQSVRARTENYNKNESYTSPGSELAVAIGGFHITTPGKHEQKDTDPNPNPWLSQEYDVFGGNRKRAHSDLPPSTGQSIQFTNNGTDEEAVARSVMLSQLLHSGLSPQTAGGASKTSFQNEAEVVDNLFGPHCAISSGPRSVSDEYANYARYLAKQDKSEKALMEESSVDTQIQGWVILEHADALAEEVLKRPQQNLLYQAPKNRSLPKLRIDTSVAVQKPVQQSQSAPVEPNSSSWETGGPSSYIPPTTTPTSGLVWGPYTGESNEPSAFISHTEEAAKIIKAIEQASGYQSTAATAIPALPRIPPHLRGLPTGDRYAMEATVLPPPLPDLPYKPPEPSSPIRERQPSYRYFSTFKAAPKYMPENTHPHNSNSNYNNNRGHLYHQQHQQQSSPGRFPRPGYQGIARPAPTRVPMHNQEFTSQLQGGGADWMTHGGEGGGLGVYMLREIPHTGPRYIR
ncbi:hypothetical protein FN846DRAFT_1009762, partial [Sphaerosporella brunnea]